MLRKMHREQHQYDAANRPMVLVFSIFAGLCLLKLGYPRLEHRIPQVLADAIKYMTTGKPFALAAVGNWVVLIFVWDFSWWFEQRRRLREWTQVHARCVSRDVVRKRVVGQAGSAGHTWAANASCVFELDGTAYEVSPLVSLATWSSKQAAEAFLNRKIDREDGCLLLVNPDDPADAELLPLDKRAISGLGFIGAAFVVVFLLLLFDVI